MHWEILDKKRLDILPKISFLKEEGFYLAGGTGLALQIGHRDSIDFDFFVEGDYDRQAIFDKLSDIFSGNIQKVQDESGTLTVFVEENIKISLFKYKYPLLNNLIETENINVASVEDIACMKLNAICNRNTIKDYVDLFFILKDITIIDLLDLVNKKIPELDTMLILKSLMYFDDIEMEPVIFKTEPVSLEEMKEFLTKTVFDYQNKI